MACEAGDGVAGSADNGAGQVLTEVVVLGEAYAAVGIAAGKWVQVAS